MNHSRVLAHNQSHLKGINLARRARATTPKAVYDVFQVHTCREDLKDDTIPWKGLIGFAIASRPLEAKILVWFPTSKTLGLCAEFPFGNLTKLL